MASTDSAETSPSSQFPGALIRGTAAYAWRLLVIGTVIYFAVKLLEKLSFAVIPFVVAMLVTALLHPVAAKLRSFGASRWVATLVALLGALVVFGGLLTVVVVRAAQQAPQLGNEVNALIPHIKHWLIHGPLRLNATTVNNAGQTITNDISKNSSRIASTALSTGRTALEVLSGMVLAVFVTIFLVYDGDGVWAFLMKGVPVQARERVQAAGRAAWTTISYYVRGTLIVALFHGIVVGITLLILGVPLAFPLAVLVGLGAFVPLVGAVVTGVLAVAVAGLAKGLIAAIIVTAVLLINNQVEAHGLQPFVVGRYVKIHPLATVMSLAVGAILFGIVGAVVAVPVVATVNSAARAAGGGPLPPAVQDAAETAEPPAETPEPPPEPPPESPPPDP